MQFSPKSGRDRMTGNKSKLPLNSGISTSNSADDATKIHLCCDNICIGGFNVISEPLDGIVAKLIIGPNNDVIITDRFADSVV
ncbi:hypothetical protein AWV79_33635 [Cupriavidus sp. UYMMa02A]|nr:hypothetical protein AWV79_33635 [Cupriavidus sp. UYMMa02A]